MKTFISRRDLKERVKSLGKQISKDFIGKEVVIIGVLKGSTIFLADLIREIKLDCSMDFIAVSSYEGIQSTGIVKLKSDISIDIKGKHVILVEDIVDTGTTIEYVSDLLKDRGPKTLDVCTLLDKRECRKVPVELTYIGFTIPNEFVVGYGLDFNEKYRNLPFIGIYAPSRATSPTH